MKNSERIKIAIQETDNDLREFGLQKQYNRAIRSETFEEVWLPLLERVTGVCVCRNGCYEFYFNNQRIQFYPKANRLLFTKENRWQSGGLKWIIKTFKINS